MAGQFQILPITGCSDGDGRRRPKTGDFVRNDSYWLQRIATEKWAKDLGIQQPGVTYSLDRLPDGFGGYEKARAPRGESPNHIDRYVYGHPKGVFRSLVEFYPHFKWLVEHENARGCPCKLCAGNGKRSSAAERRSESGSVASGRSPSAPPKPRSRPDIGPESSLPTRPPPDKPRPQRAKQIDEEGTLDTLRALLDNLKIEGPQGKIEEIIIENLSPDWRTGHAMLSSTLKEWSILPNYVPRQGELVLFARHVDSAQTLRWNSTTQTFGVANSSDRSWAEPPTWEAGVVTQMPIGPIADEDLEGTSKRKEQSIVHSGFRIEPLSKPTSMTKPYNKQHKYVPLHAIRPLSMWQECLGRLEEKNWHPTVRHALSVMSSMCLVGRYSFKGTWPEATVFAQGLFIGSELVMIGDAVRLYSRAGEQMQDVITDVMIITAIKSRIVDLDKAGDDDQDDGDPYTMCIHISGKAYTQDPRRSFDGVGKAPIPSDSDLLPPVLRGLGKWYSVCNPQKPKARIEVPYQRVIGRCYGFPAWHAWLEPFSHNTSSSPRDITSSQPHITVHHNQSIDISHGLAGVLAGREYSQQHDPRIDRDSGKTWFWADTRVEQLDLHEVNGHLVGAKDRKRDRAKVEHWRKALRALDGKKGGLEEYHAARRQREQAQARRESVLGASSSGLVAGGAQAVAGSGTEGEAGTGGDDDEQGEHDPEEIEQPGTAGRVPESSGGDQMEVDAGAASVPVAALPGPAAQGGGVDVLDDHEDDDV